MRHSEVQKSMKTVCERASFLTMWCELNYNHSYHILILEDASRWPVPPRTFITFYRSRSCPSRRFTTWAGDVSIRCELLQGQHVHSQYWTGDARWHSAKVNVESKYNPSPDKKHSSIGEASSEALAGLCVPSTRLFCSSPARFIFFFSPSSSFISLYVSSIW